jgi:hypothetical protein
LAEDVVPVFQDFLTIKKRNIVREEERDISCINNHRIAVKDKIQYI